MGWGVLGSLMFALEPCAPLLTRVQNPLKLDFESLRGDKMDKEAKWGGLEEAWEQARQCHPLLGELGTATLLPSNLPLPSGQH